MSWRFWSRSTEPEAEPDHTAGADDLPSDFDLRELLATPPPVPRATGPKDRPVYTDPAQLDQDATFPGKKADYLKLKPSELRRQRERREAQNSFWARLRRGELSTSDLPGQGAVSGLFFRLAQTLLSPFAAVFENMGVVIAALVALAACTLAAYGLMDFMDFQFGGLLR